MSAREIGHVGQRVTFLDMNEDELRDLVRKLRKEKRRLKDRLDQAKRSPDWFEADGNRGGSFVRLSKVWNDDFRAAKEGMVRLEVGETCIVTVQQDISVAGLAAILTRCKDVGFQKIVDEYLATPNAGGCPRISVEHDLPPTSEAT